MQRVVTSIAAAVFTAVVLVGCTTADGSASSGSEGGHAASSAPATPTPTVMSDEEALQTGVETFEQLMAAELKMIETKGASLEEFDALITSSLSDYRESVIDAASKDYTAHGSMKVYLPKLQRAAENQITFYACLKMDEGYVTDSSGEVVGGDRTGKIGSVEITVLKGESGNWQVDRKSKWEDPEHCSSLRS